VGVVNPGQLTGPDGSANDTEPSANQTASVTPITAATQVFLPLVLAFCFIFTIKFKISITLYPKFPRRVSSKTMSGDLSI
jgi:hypothetical protein